MRIGRYFLPACVLVVAASAVHCGDDDVAAPPVLGQDAGPGFDDDATSATDGMSGDSVTNPRLDVLFVVDNSYLMVEKEASLAESLGVLFRGLHARDVHVGMVTTSFGVRDLCPFGVQDDKAHLIHRISRDPDAGIVPGTESGFLTFGPGGEIDDVETLAERTALLIRGAADEGCGIEAQLEAFYRFTTEPDPPLSVTIDPVTNLPVAKGVDYELLAQRKAFFRPDSTVAIILLSDEDDSSIDLFSAGGFGHSYFAAAFPGSKVALGESFRGFTVARATSACASDPTSADCTSCAFGAKCDPTTEACQKIRNDSSCSLPPGTGETGPGYDGYYGPSDDSINLRAFDMKRRFGVEARYPISRYVAALTGRRVPNRAAAHPESVIGGVRTIGPYVQAETCANPLLSDGLPAKEGDELCELRPGPRTTRHILFGFIGGTLPGDPSASPSWELLLGRDPESFDFAGIDPHMLLSIEPRAGLSGAALPLGDNGSDPIHGREWQTQNEDIQYACTYSLSTPLDCAESVAVPCDCPRDGVSPNPPLCDGANHRQTRGKAYPSPRELLVAKALGERAVVASACGGKTEYAAFHQALTKKINSQPPCGGPRQHEDSLRE